MTETEAPIPKAEIERRAERRWPSPVWMVPVLAIAAAVFLLVQNVATRGPLITLSLPAASGLRAGESVVKYRDVDVGQVQAIRFSDDLQTVLAEIRMDQTVAPFLDSSARFWVVRPEVSAQGISGLETVISGTYIQGTWDTEPGDPMNFFVAQDRPPQTPEGTPGTRLRLIAPDANSLEVGSPIFFKGLEVGRVENKQLSEDGSAIEFDVFINAPNDRRLTQATRFWNASGIDLEFGADGARLRIASLTSLLRGGASFSNFGADDAQPIAPGHVYTLFTSQSDAAENATTGDVADAVALQVRFSGSVRGLRPGAAVEYRGIRIGRVTEVNATVAPESGEFLTSTVIGLSPTLLGLASTDRDSLLQFLDEAVAKGLRAKLAMGNLLTGSLYVNLEDVPTALPMAFDPAAEVPELPSAASDLDALTGSVEGILQRVDALPIEALLGNATALLENLNRIAANADTQELPAAALRILADAEALVSRPELAQVTIDAQATVAALRAVAEDEGIQTAPEKLDALLVSVAALTSELERQGTAADLAATIAGMRRLAQSPELIALPEQANRALAAMMTILEQPTLSALPAQIDQTLADLRTALDLPGLNELPNELSETLASVRARLDDPALGQALAELPIMLADTRAAVQDVSTGADAVLASLADILDDPGTRAAPAEIAATLESARMLLEDQGLRDTVGEAGPTLAALRALLQEPGMLAAPGELSATLASARELLRSLEEAKAAESLARTLTATRNLVENPALTNASNELAATLAALRDVLDDQGFKDLPPALVRSLNAAANLIDQFERENLAGSANAALDSVSAAGRSAERSLTRLPRLLARLDAVAVRADELLASVSVGSELNYEAVTAIREIRDAARSVTDLVDLLERQPNSLILGK